MSGTQYIPRHGRCIELNMCAVAFKIDYQSNKIITKEIQSKEKHLHDSG